MRSLLPALLLASCAHNIVIPVFGPTKECRTPCGMVNQNYQGDCKDIDEYERRAVIAFSEDNFNKDSPICRVLDGWHLAFVDAENGVFEVGHKKYARGATILDSKLILLGTVKALPHEIGHVLDIAGGATQEQSSKHERWRVRGYCFAIRIASATDLKCEED